MKQYILVSANAIAIAKCCLHPQLKMEGLLSLCVWQNKFNISYFLSCTFYFMLAWVFGLEILFVFNHCPWVHKDWGE